MARRPRVVITAAVILCVVIAIPVMGATATGGKPLARNVILLIDDGAGYNAHELGSLYATGERAGEAYNEFPFRFAVSTYSYGDVLLGSCGEPVGYDPSKAWSDWSYVTLDPTDSAAAATAMATGVKTYDAAIGVGCDGEALPNVVEAYERMGKATGVVTSVPISHATPAAFVAHNPDRDDNPGIAHEMVEVAAVDVIMGGGHPFFSRIGKASKNGGFAWIGQSDWDALVAGTAGGDADGDGTADPWTLVQTRAEFQALATGETPSRVFGMAQVRRTLQEDRVDLTTLPAGTVVAPYSVPFIATVPTLAEMTAGALNILDNDPDGFFVMIEGGATDWAGHDNQAGLMVEEEIAFDDAFDTVMAWVDANSNWGETLVVVVSDHETGYLTGPGSGDTADGPVWTPLVDNGAGTLPGATFNLTKHTNSLIPLYAKGDAGRVLRQMVVGDDPIRGVYVDNTAIYHLLMRAAGLDS